MTDSKRAGRTPVRAGSLKVMRPSKVKPSGARMARFHYHKNRATGTLVVHQKVEVGGKSVEMGMNETEFASLGEMKKAVSSWLASNDHSFDALISTKHCN